MLASHLAPGKLRVTEVIGKLFKFNEQATFLTDVVTARHTKQLHRVMVNWCIKALINYVIPYKVWCIKDFVLKVAPINMEM
jgi:hypothetical protein